MNLLIQGIEVKPIISHRTGRSLCPAGDRLPSSPQAGFFGSEDPWSERAHPNTIPRLSHPSSLRRPPKLQLLPRLCLCPSSRPIMLIRIKCIFWLQLCQSRKRCYADFHLLRCYPDIPHYLPKLPLVPSPPSISASVITVVVTETATELATATATTTVWTIKELSRHSHEHRLWRFRPDRHGVRVRQPR